jgi:hypothetical protein
MTHELILKRRDHADFVVMRAFAGRHVALHLVGIDKLPM